MYAGKADRTVWIRRGAERTDKGGCKIIPKWVGCLIGRPFGLGGSGFLVFGVGVGIVDRRQFSAELGCPTGLWRLVLRDWRRSPFTWTSCALWLAIFGLSGLSG